jgi:hypothetical protein
MFQVGDIIVSTAKIVSRIDPEYVIWPGHLGSITQVFDDSEDGHKEFNVKFKNNDGCYDLFGDEIENQITITNTVWIIIVGPDGEGGLAVWPEEVSTDDVKGNCFPTQAAAMTYLETQYGKPIED